MGVAVEDIYLLRQLVLGQRRVVHHARQGLHPEVRILKRDPRPRNHLIDTLHIHINGLVYFLNAHTFVV